MTPDEHTNQELFIKIGDGHTVYVHDWGQAETTLPIFMLHGGPGGGCKDSHKARFDPTRQRVIFHDQRGAGRSTPHGSLERNTTAELIADITRVADQLSIARFIIAGGSWGACLALAYGLAQPQRVAGLVLDAVFTGTRTEIDWLNTGLFRDFYPDAWQQLLAQTPSAARANPGSWHYQQILSDDPAATRASGLAMQNLSGAIMDLDDRFAPATQIDELDLDSLRLEAHYLTQGCFLQDQHILGHAAELTMPVYLLQGRYDMVSPPATAYALSQALPNGELFWTINGHWGGHETWNLRQALLAQLTER